ncbi:hypothetical protein ACFPN7_04485 [Amycolatopsis halotolerans]|uniref:hypothetical protein n=1 Tax=Amycolatopsis halotolerans TaxID=330083 RepID=UPI003612CC4C
MIWLTFVDTKLVGTVNVGLVGLAVNVVVLAIAAAIERAVTRSGDVVQTGEPV